VNADWTNALLCEARRIEFPSLIYFLTWATALRRLRCLGVRLCALRGEVDGD